jgi:inward rectifier potassium channel
MAKRRVLSGFGTRPLVALGLPRQASKDLYHSLLTARWRELTLWLLLAYLAANALFALGYLATGDGIENARPGSFADAFFFSVQTLATIGYGKMAPRTLAANALVTIEALLGLVSLALVTGLVFAKFSRPTARVLFSEVAVVTRFDGVPSLLFRMANARANQIVEAQLRASIVRTEVTAEGEGIGRVHDLKLRRDRSPFFSLTWTAIHPITPDSPLFGATPESLRTSATDVVVSLTGYDASLSQTIHARHAYGPEQVLWNARFRDIFVDLPDGQAAIDYGLLHETFPDGGSPA